MDRVRRNEDYAMISRLFFKLLPVQVAIVAMGSINSIVDGVVAARFIDASTVGVVGLYYTVARILEAVGAVLLGGVSVLSGKSLGRGQIDETRGICTLGMVLATLFGAFLTIVSFVMPEIVARMLGANDLLLEPLSAYIVGYAIGIIPQLLAQQFAACLQLERKENLAHLGITVMIVMNVVLDILFVSVMNMGVWGLALSTSLANWAYLIVLVQHYFSKKIQLKPSLSLIPVKETMPLLRIGFPGALLVAGLAARSLIINRLLLSYAGNDGLSALSAFCMVLGLIYAVAIGAGSLVRMLSSVYLGEENREGLRSLIRFSLTRVLPIMLAVGLLVVLLSSMLASIFFPDRSTEVYRMTKELFFIFGFAAPISLPCLIFSNYFQAAGHRLFTNMISLVDGFFSGAIPALLLTPMIGAMGVWLSYDIGLLLTLIIDILYPIIMLRRIPKQLDEWLLLPSEFGDRNGLIFHIWDEQAVCQVAEKVQDFCDSNGIAHKTGAHAGLCMEEMSGNIVRHGFIADKKNHMVEVRVSIRKEGVTLRIKDDCIPFDPKEWYEMTSVAEDPAANVGIRLVCALAKDINYQNLLGLNVLTIQL